MNYIFYRKYRFNEDREELEKKQLEKELSIYFTEAEVEKLLLKIEKGKILETPIAIYFAKKEGKNNESTYLHRSFSSCIS